MIIGTKEDLKNYKGLNERIDKAIDFISTLDENIADGKYELCGDALYVNVTSGNTTAKDEIIYEAHRKYLDLQYIINGSESMFYAPLSKCTPTMEYNEESDYCLYTAFGSELHLESGNFYLLHPNDAHAPGKGNGETSYRKAIVKIMID